MLEMWIRAGRQVAELSQLNHQRVGYVLQTVQYCLARGTGFQVVGDGIQLLSAEFSEQVVRQSVRTWALDHFHKLLLRLPLTSRTPGCDWSREFIRQGVPQSPNAIVQSLSILPCALLPASSRVHWPRRLRSAHRRPFARTLPRCARQKTRGLTQRPCATLRGGNRDQPSRSKRAAQWSTSAGGDSFRNHRPLPDS